MDKGEIEIVLRRLNEKQRQIILLRCEGKTHEEVAGLVYVSVPHSKKTISLLYQMLYLTELPDAQKQAYLIERVKPILLQIKGEVEETDGLDNKNVKDAMSDDQELQPNQGSTPGEQDAVAPTNYEGLAFDSDTAERDDDQNLQSGQGSIPNNPDEVELSEDNGLAFDSTSDKNEEQGDQLEDYPSDENVMSDNPEDFAGIEPNRRNNRSRRVVTIIGFVIGFLVIMACIGTLFIQNNNLRNQISVLSTENLSAQTILKETVIQEVVQIVTEEVTREVTVVVPPTSGPEEPLATQEQIVVVVTATPPPPTPTQEGQLVSPGESFFDDFEEGIDPAWIILSGEIGMSNGKMTVITPYTQGRGMTHLVQLDNLIWENYRATIDLAGFPAQHESSMGCILIRYNPNGESIGLRFSGYTGYVELGYFSKNQEWTPYPGTYYSNYFGTPNSIRIESRGEIYKVFINEDLVASATISGPTSGFFGIWILSSGEDNAAEYAPRFEYIRLEAFE